MRRTILQEVNPILVHAVENHAIQGQTQQILPIHHKACRTGRLYPLDRLRLSCRRQPKLTRPFVTAISLALSVGTISILTPQKNASAAKPLMDLTKLESSAPVFSPPIPATSTSENSIQSLRGITKPLWVPKQAIVAKPIQPKPVISHIDAAPTVAYQVQPEDTVETIASSYQISEQELIKVNRLINPNVIRVDQVLAIPPAQLKSNHTMGAAGSVVPATTPSVITAAQPSGITLPILTSQAENIPVPIAPTTDDSKFRVAAGFTHQPQVSELAISANKQAKTIAGSSARIINNPSQRQTAKDLQPDIQKLQAKYLARDTEAQRNPQTVTVKLSVVSPAALENQGSEVTSSPAVGTGELSPKQTKDLQLDIQKLQDKYKIAEKADVREPVQTTVALTPKQKPVAAASTRSNFSTPIVKRTAFPQLLSPELPPLSPLDTYLPDKNLTGSLQFIWPAKGVLTSGYGRRWGRMHQGIDVAAPIGTPVVAAALGIVVHSGWSPGGYGNVVNILHPDGSLTRYAHNKKLLVRPGQEINQGHQIAEMGSTGRSTGPHLHFEIRPSGKGAVNPMFYLSRG